MNIESLLIVADNLKRYMAANGLDQRTVAKKSGVPQRTINYILNATPEKNSTLRTIEEIATGLGIPVWYLLVPDLPIELMKNKTLDRLVDNFSHAEPEGRSYIERIAEKEAGYRAPADPLDPGQSPALRTGTR